MYREQLLTLQGLTEDEYQYLEQVVTGMSEQQLQAFIMLYKGKRKSPQDILLFTLLGFVVIAGVQRFVIGQIGMGLLYLLTAGLCFIGTIVDLINHRTLALEHNYKVAYESAQMVKRMYPSV
ncbi:MAG TPA: TM2 domain-containing protein [Sphingobacteriaceae bacterium]